MMNTEDMVQKVAGVVVCRRCEKCGVRQQIATDGGEKAVLRCPQCGQEECFYKVEIDINQSVFADACA